MRMVSTMDEELREMLRRKAGAVPAHKEVPMSLIRRARRRIARNVIAWTAAVVVVVGGGFVAVRALSTTPNERPVPPASTSSATPTHPARQTHSSSPTPPVSTTACAAGQLRAVGTLEGAAGSREGAVVITNFSDKTCTLEGSPTITLLDEQLNPITSGVSFSTSPAGWQVDASPRPVGWPVVTLAPGDAASVRLRWSNWCPQGRAAPLWKIGIPSGGTIDGNGLDAVGAPPCNGPGSPSTIEVGPFEPAPKT